ncbi:MAG TPA: hypothetical protein VMV05_03025 [bacterium]|nr:hypothetical protein [bacterium]
MKKTWIAGMGAVLVVGLAMAGPLRGHPNLKMAHNKIKGALVDLVAAQKANEYDLGGHAAKAELLLIQAEKEVNQAAEVSNSHR